MVDKFVTIKDFADKSWVRSDGPGIAKESRFRVRMKLPKIFELADVPYDYFDETMSINVVSANLPSLGLAEQNSPFRKGISGRAAPNILTLSFFESNNLDVKNFFYNWINAIVDPRDDNMYEVRFFYEEFVGTMSVYHIDKSGEVDITKCDYFIDVYPLTLNNINYNIGNENNLAMVNVDFSYRFHRMKFEP